MQLFIATGFILKRNSMRKLLFILALLCVPLARGQSSFQNPLQGPITATSANCAVAGDQSCVWQKLAANAAVATVQVSGTFSATLTVEANNGGANFTALGTITTAGTTSYVVAGFTDFRVRASAYTSGTAFVTINSSIAPSGGVTSGTGAPTGSCTANQIYVNQSNGNLYSCSGGSWVLSGGGGSGTVTNIATTGPISGGPITTTGTISCPTCTTSAGSLASGNIVTGAGSKAVQDSGIAATSVPLLGSSPIFSTTDTLSDTVTTEQLFATKMTIPANTLVANVAYKFFVQAEWTSVVTIPNATFQIYLCPTSGSLTGCKNVYKSQQTTMASGAGTFNSGMEFGFEGETAAGATATVMMMSSGTGAANCPFGRSTVAASQGNIPTNANLFVQFSVTYASAAGAGANTLSIRALVAEPSPLH
jgi:hypothetical protein